MGGGAMRTVAKAASIGGYRSGVAFASNAAAAVSRRSSRPATATIPAATTAPVEGGGSSISLLSGKKSRNEATVVPPASQCPSWEVDDWEFAGWEEEEEGSFDLMTSAPRLVFGPVPTLEEAKEATSDLKDALDKVYFSEPVDEVPGKHGEGQNTLESASVISVMPRHVVQAFSLLQGSSEAQNVVASLASDKNVWDAVMQNEKVIEFYRNHQSNAVLIESVSESALSEGSAENSDDPSADTFRSSSFKNFVDNIQKKVMEMVGNLSSFLQDFFGTSGEAHSTNSKSDSSTSNSYVDVALGTSFIGLAIAVIMVVLVKRG
ncbi:uncharacterized protein [Typha latifolia]|uniref:uncharacterized protein isoform X2 n=1 Tax=Typha latifolia TaxID=4733 RepID=UPI003C2B6408